MKKPRNLTVADFMTKNPISVRFDMSLEEVEKIFEHNRLTAVPVLDPFSRILGVITDFMLVKMFLQKTSKKMTGNLLSFIEDLDPILTISEGDSMQEAFKLMLRSPNHRVFVVRGEELVGALSPKDLLPHLAGSERGQRSIQDELLSAQKEILKLSGELATAKKSLVTYKKFFDDSPFMMHSVDWDGNILMANKMLHFTLGYNDRELIGKSVNDLYSHQNHQEAKDGLERIRVLGFHPPVSTLMATKRKEAIKVDVASMVRRDENGVMIGTISITRLTDNNNMMSILRQAAHMFELDSSIKTGQRKKAKS